MIFRTAHSTRKAKSFEAKDANAKKYCVENISSKDLEKEIAKLRNKSKHRRCKEMKECLKYDKRQSSNRLD